VFAPNKPPTILDEPRPKPSIDADEPTLEELERRYILKTLQRLEGNREQTARTLGINKSTLWRKLQAFEIE